MYKYVYIYMHIYYETYDWDINNKLQGINNNWNHFDMTCWDINSNKKWLYGM